MTLESCSTEFPQAACTVTRTSPGSVNRVVTELSRESRGCGHKQDQACLAGWRAMVRCQDQTGTVLAFISKGETGGLCTGSVWEVWGMLAHPSSNLNGEHALPP